MKFLENERNECILPMEKYGNNVEKNIIYNIRNY